MIYLSHLNFNIYLIVVINALLLFALISAVTIPFWQQFLPSTSVSYVGMSDIPQQRKSDASGIAFALSPAAEANSNCVKKVAFVRPSFTYAAYQLNGFYNFYRLHNDLSEGTNVTKDLNLLTVKVPHGPFLVYTQNATDVPEPIREKRFIDKLIELTAAQAPVDSIEISDVTDKEVNDGKIFVDKNNNTNAYDVLHLFHQEYVTSAEYYNLKKFVENGGRIVFNDSNIFTTEVKYNSTNDSVTLVEGHDWKYNGNSAWPAEKERWADETRQWVGSNFLQVPTKRNVTFANNPFGYNHTEEQYLTNPNDKIIFNFDAKIRDVREIPIENSITLHPTVAIYELDNNSGNKTTGKVISLSIFSYKLLNNKEFLDFYARRIIPLTFGVSNCD